MESTVTLGYWDIRGLAERIRQLLEYLSIPYNQDKYAGQEGREKWFNDVKPKLQDKNPALTLPYLIDGEKVVAESDAICVYLCHKGGKPELLGRNAEEHVALATAHGVYKDFHPNYIRLVYGPNRDEAFEQAVKDSVAQFDPYLKKINGILGDNDFIAGGLTWFDFGLADFLQTLSILYAEYLKPYPKLTAYF